MLCLAYPAKTTTLSLSVRLYCTENKTDGQFKLPKFRTFHVWNWRTAPELQININNNINLNNNNTQSNQINVENGQLNKNGKNKNNKIKTITTAITFTRLQFYHHSRWLLKEFTWWMGSGAKQMPAFTQNQALPHKIGASTWHSSLPYVIQPKWKAELF